jgi:hypothetical protein
MRPRPPVTWQKPASRGLPQSHLTRTDWCGESEIPMDNIMPAESGNPNSSLAFVVMGGQYPLATAATLEAAQAAAYSRESQYRPDGESRWDEHGTDAWRLMRRSGNRGRFAWTQYWVAAVPALTAGGAR